MRTRPRLQAETAAELDALSGCTGIHGTAHRRNRK
jgi:hypothetical protein